MKKKVIPLDALVHFLGPTPEEKPSEGKAPKPTEDNKSVLEALVELIQQKPSKASPDATSNVVDITDQFVGKALLIVPAAKKPE